MGMQAAVTRHDITAHDVANVNTRGFEQGRPHQTDVVPGGVRISSVSRTPNKPLALSNSDLVDETKEQIQNEHTLKANAQVIRAKDRMMGEVIDLLA